MNKSEKDILKQKYHQYKHSYERLKKEIKSVPKDSLEYYEIINELSALGTEIAKLRQSLMNARLEKLNPANLLEKFLSKDEETKGGR